MTRRRLWIAIALTVWTGCSKSPPPSIIPSNCPRLFVEIERSEGSIRARFKGEFIEKTQAPERLLSALKSGDYNLVELRMPKGADDEIKALVAQLRNAAWSQDFGVIESYATDDPPDGYRR